MPTVLLAWELGSGLGHVARLRHAAIALAAHGVHVVAAVKNLKTSAVLADAGAELVQAPVWPATFLSEAQRNASSSATFGDMLADFGLADAATMTAMLSAWDRIFALCRPDLIVADYAPAVGLAARGRIPLAIVGDGFTVPPAEMPSFPALHRMSPPTWPEAQVLDAVNAVLGQRKAPRLDRLPQILECDVRSVQTFQMLDPYQSQRTVPADGPPIVMPRARRADASSILAYIATGGPRRDEIVSVLRPFGARLRAYVPGLSSRQTAELAGAGATIEHAPMGLTEELSSACLMIHFGGIGVANTALAAGVPQLVLSLDIEKDLTGAALERAGAGRMVKLHDPAAQLSVELIEMLVQDAAVAARAAALGESHRALLRDYDTLPKFERDCLRLLV